MMKFNTYRLLNESLGMHSLGVKTTQSLGIQSNMPGLGEAGVPPELDAKKGKKPPFGGDPTGAAGPIGDAPPSGDEDMDMGGEDMGGDDLGGEMDDLDGTGDDLGGDEGGEMDVHAKIAELEAELEKLKAQIGGEEGDDMDADLDHEDDLGDLDGEEGDDEEGDSEDEPELPFAKGKGTPFMKKEAAEADGKMEKGKGKDGPVFMMKKAKKCGSGMDDKKVILGKSKKCGAADDSGMLPMKKCKKCTSKMDKKMHKEATGYERPKNIDNSDDAWLNSIRSQLATTSVDQKFDDGMRKFTNEDLLLAPANGGLEAVQEKAPAPLEAGDLGFTTEALQDIIGRLARLEKGN